MSDTGQQVTADQEWSKEYKQYMLDLASELGQRRMQDKQEKINTHVRLFDLVRYHRSELHQTGLITDDEYDWLMRGCPMSRAPGGGSPSPRRLEDYDRLRVRLQNVETNLRNLIIAASSFAETMPAEILRTAEYQAFAGTLANIKLWNS